MTPTATAGQDIVNALAPQDSFSMTAAVLICVELVSGKPAADAVFNSIASPVMQNHVKLARTAMQTALGL
jgi:hypothetical protein